MAERLLEARDLVKTYPSGNTVLRVLDRCSIAIDVGEQMAIVGPSGVGKSTLLHLLAGLDRPDSGSICFRGNELAAFSEERLAAMRGREVGMVFQFYHLLSEFTALENVVMPLLITRELQKAEERASFLLEEVGLEGRGHHYPPELSGGERQRVAIARALACKPSVILADEPTGNLDQQTGERVLELFRNLHQRHSTALVMVTHNLELTAGFDRVLTMVRGGKLKLTKCFKRDPE